MARPNHSQQNQKPDAQGDTGKVEWDDPPDTDLHDRQSAVVASDYRKNNLPAQNPAPVVGSNPVAQPEPGHDASHFAAPPVTAQADASLQARIAELEAENATLKKAAKPKPSIPAFEIPETANVEPEFAEVLKKQFAARDELIEELREQLESTRGNIGKLETEQSLTREERALTKLLDHLPSDHFRAVYEGDDANDRYREAAAEVQSLREFDKSKGRKRSDAELFRAATINLFTDKAEESRAKGGRPRGGKDRSINRVNPAAAAPVEFGVNAAKQAAHSYLVSAGAATNGWNPNHEDTGY